MKPVLSMGQSLLFSDGSKWVYLDSFPGLDSPISFENRPIVRLEELRDLVLEKGLESVYGTLQEDITLDWYLWFSSDLKVPDGPSRGAIREATKVLDKAMAKFERVFFDKTGKEPDVSIDYLYTQFVQVMGLEVSVDWDDLSQWELNLLTTVEMAFSAILVAYLEELDPEKVLPAVFQKLHQLFGGLSSAMDYAVNLIDQHEFTEPYK